MAIVEIAPLFTVVLEQRHGHIPKAQDRDPEGRKLETDGEHVTVLLPRVSSSFFVCVGLASQHQPLSLTF